MQIRNDNFQSITSNDLKASANETCISVFNFEGNSEIRVDTNNGNPLFCLCDVCQVLDISNPSYVKERLKQEGIFLKYTLTKGGKQSLLFIDESNLYKVIFRSDKPNARKFEDWVTSEILPAIRKTGVYAAKQAAGKLTGQYIQVTGADDNLYLLSMLKDFREFIVEETQEHCFHELRLVKKFEAACTLFPEQKMKMRGSGVNIA